MSILLISHAAVGQETNSDKWRFRFPDTKAGTASREEIDSRRVALVPSTKEFRAPKIRVPDLADSQIKIPESTKSRPSARTPPSLANSSANLVAQPNQIAPRIAARDPFGVLPTQYGENLQPFDGTTSFLPVRPSGERIWVRPEYLLWEATGLRLPALVTTSNVGTPALGLPGTTVLAGQGNLLDGYESGWKITAGLGLDAGGRFRIEGDYLRMFDRNASFRATSDDPLNPTNVIGRPFFNVAPGTAAEQAQIISLAGTASGTIGIDFESRLRSYGIYGRASTAPAPGPCDPVPLGGWGLSNRFDFLVGYRFANLEDVIEMRESVTGLNAGNAGTVSLRDSFQTDNKFYGIELGMIYYGSWNRFSTEFSTKLAVGRNEQTVLIDGYTDITQAGATTRHVGGLLAQRTNIGKFENDEITVLPQLGMTLGTQLTSCWYLRFGYQVFYIGNVVRAGDQIDTDLNAGLFPIENPVVTSNLRPRLLFRETDYWTHGFTFGTDLRF